MAQIFNYCGSEPRGMVEKRKLQATIAGNISSVYATQDFDNGAYVQLDGLYDIVEYGQEVYAPKPLEAGSQGGVVLIASPEVVYDERLGIETFYNKEGSTMTGYYLVKGDHYTTTIAPYIDGTPAEDDIYVIDEGEYGLVALGAGDLEDHKFAVQVVALVPYFGEDSVVLKVIKNEG